MPPVEPASHGVGNRFLYRDLSNDGRKSLGWETPPPLPAGYFHETRECELDSIATVRVPLRL